MYLFTVLSSKVGLYYTAALYPLPICATGVVGARVCRDSKLGSVLGSIAKPKVLSCQQ